MSNEPNHSPMPWVHDSERCAIRYQLPVDHPDRYSDDAEEDDGWRNVVSLLGACGGIDIAADIAVMTAAPALLAALRVARDFLDGELGWHGSNASDDLRAAHAAADAAIAAAEGRSDG